MWAEKGLSWKGTACYALWRTSCAVEEESLPARVLDDHDGSVVVVQAAEDLGRTSFQHRDILRLHCLAACWERGKREKNVNIVTQMVWDGEKEGWRKETGGTDAAERKTSSICTSLEIEPFKIRYSKHPSFAHYSSCGHNKAEEGRVGERGMEEGKRRGGQSEIKNERETRKNSTSWW